MPADCWSRASARPADDSLGQALWRPRGHRTLAITRKGGKRAVIPLDLAIGERCEGPIFITPAGQRLDRHGAGRVVRRVAKRAGLAKKVGPHTLRHAFITAALDAGVPLRDVQEAASHARPAHHHALRPGQGLPRPARHIHLRGLHRGAARFARRKPGAEPRLAGPAPPVGRRHHHACDCPPREQIASRGLVRRDGRTTSCAALALPEWSIRVGRALFRRLARRARIRRYARFSLVLARLLRHAA